MSTNDAKFSQLNDDMLETAHGGGDGNYTPICGIAETNVATIPRGAASESIAASAFSEANTGDDEPRPLKIPF